MKKERKDKSILEPHQSFEVVGGWISLARCRICGAAIFLSSNKNIEKIHESWHRSIK